MPQVADEGNGTGAGAAALFVVTDDEGNQQTASGPVRWALPTPHGAGEAVEGDLVLREARALLGHLGPRVHRAEALDAAGEPFVPEDVDDSGVVRVPRARLVASTGWGGFSAAMFALDCAEHVLPHAGDVTLADGTPLAAALATVRASLSTAASEADGGLLARLRELALARRIRKQGRSIGDAAFEAVIADEAADVAATDDPVWTAVAAARDAVVAAVEAVQGAALPHVSSAEGEAYEAGERVLLTDGQAGHGHPPAAWVPASLAADDAAERARQAAAAGGGEEAERAERRWQAERLAGVLGAGA